VHHLALSGKQSVQLAHLALVPGASAFGPNVVMHGVKGDAPGAVLSTLFPSPAPAGEGAKVLMEVMSTTAASTRTPVKAPAWAAAMGRFNSYLVNDFGGGPRPWKLAWVINFQKVGNSVRTKDQPPSHSVAARSDPRAWANVIDLRLDD
jgi:hypothetical protein